MHRAEAPSRLIQKEDCAFQPAGDFRQSFVCLGNGNRTRRHELLIGAQGHRTDVDGIGGCRWGFRQGMPRAFQN